MKKCVLASLMVVASLNLSAEVRLPSVICDGMVLQRGQPISIWGWADSEGRWELNDILIGDVFLCSGQSNMELPIRRVTDMRYDRDKLVIQESDAIWWRDACVQYFGEFSGMPVPADVEQPERPLEELKKIKLDMKHHN